MNVSQRNLFDLDTSLKSTTNERDELQRELIAVSIKLAKVEEANVKSLERVTQLEDENSRLRDIIATLESESFEQPNCSHAKEGARHIKVRPVKLEETLIKISQLEAKYETAVRERDELKDELVASERRTAEIKTLLRKTEDASNELEEVMATVKSELLKYKGDMESATKQTSNLKAELEEERSKVEKLSKEIASSQSRYEEFQRNVDWNQRESTSKDKIIDELRESLAAYELQNESLYSEVSKLQGQLKTTEQKRRELQEEVIDAQERLRDAATESKQAAEENVKLSIELQLFYKRLSELQASFNACEHEKYDFQQQIMEQQHNVTKLETELEEAMKQRSLCDLRKKEFASNLSAVGQNVASLKRQVADKQQMTNDFCKAIMEKETLTKQLQRKLDALNVDLVPSVPEALLVRSITCKRAVFYAREMSGTLGIDLDFSCKKLKDTKDLRETCEKEKEIAENQFLIKQEGNSMAQKLYETASKPKVQLKIELNMGEKSEANMNSSISASFKSNHDVQSLLNELEEKAENKLSILNQQLEETVLEEEEQEQEMNVLEMLNSEVEQADSTCSQVKEKEIASSQSHYAEIRRNVDWNQRESTSKDKIIDELRESLATYELQNESLYSEVSKLQEQLKTTEEKRRELQVEVLDVHERLRDAATESKQAAEENVKLSIELQSFYKRLSELQASFNACEHEKYDFQQQIMEQQHNETKLETELEKAMNQGSVCDLRKKEFANSFGAVSPNAASLKCHVADKRQMTNDFWKEIIEKETLTKQIQRKLDVLNVDLVPSVPEAFLVRLITCKRAVFYAREMSGTLGIDLDISCRKLKDTKDLRETCEKEKEIAENQFLIKQEGNSMAQKLHETAPKPKVQLKTELNMGEKSVANMNSSISASYKSNHDVQSLLNELEEKAENKLSILNQQLEETVLEEEEQERELNVLEMLNSEVEQADSTCSQDKEKEIASSQSRYAEIRRNVDWNKKESISKDEIIDELRESLATYELQNESLYSKVSKLQGQLKKTEEEKRELQEEVLDAQERLRDAAAESKQAAEENVKLSIELQSFYKRMSELQASFNACEHEKYDFLHHFMEQQHNVTKLETGLEEAMKQRFVCDLRKKEFAKRFGAVSSNAASLKSQVADKQQMTNDFWKEIIEKETLTKQIQRKLDVLNVDLVPSVPEAFLVRLITCRLGAFYAREMSGTLGVDLDFSCRKLKDTKDLRETCEKENEIAENQFLINQEGHSMAQKLHETASKPIVQPKTELNMGEKSVANMNSSISASYKSNHDVQSLLDELEETAENKLSILNQQLEETVLEEEEQERELNVLEMLNSEVEQVDSTCSQVKEEEIASSQSRYEEFQRNIDCNQRESTSKDKIIDELRESLATYELQNESPYSEVSKLQEQMKKTEEEKREFQEEVLDAQERLRDAEAESKQVAEENVKLSIELQSFYKRLSELQASFNACEHEKYDFQQQIMEQQQNVTKLETELEKAMKEHSVCDLRKKGFASNFGAVADKRQMTNDLWKEIMEKETLTKQLQRKLDALNVDLVPSVPEAFLVRLITCKRAVFYARERSGTLGIVLDFSCKKPKDTKDLREICEKEKEIAENQFLVKQEGHSMVQKLYETAPKPEVQLKTELNMGEKSVANMNSSISASYKSNNDVQSLLNELEETAENKLSFLNQQLEETVLEEEEKERELNVFEMLNSEVEQSDSTCSQVKEKEIASSQSRYAETRRNVDRNQKESISKDEIIDELRESLATYELQNESLYSEVSKLQEQLKKTEEEKREFREEVLDAQERLRDAVAEHKQAAEENVKLSIELQSFYKRLSELQASFNACEHEKYDFQLQIMEQQHNEAKLETELEEATKQRFVCDLRKKEFASNFGAVSQNVASLKRQVADKQQMTNDFWKEITEKETLTKQLRRKLDVLNVDLVPSVPEGFLLRSITGKLGVFYAREMSGTLGIDLDFSCRKFKDTKDLREICENEKEIAENQFLIKQEGHSWAQKLYETASKPIVQLETELNMGEKSVANMDSSISASYKSNHDVRSLFNELEETAENKLSMLNQQLEETVLEKEEKERELNVFEMLNSEVEQVDSTCRQVKEKAGEEVSQIALREQLAAEIVNTKLTYDREKIKTLESEDSAENKVIGEVIDKEIDRKDQIVEEISTNVSQSTEVELERATRESEDRECQRLNRNIQESRLLMGKLEKPEKPVKEVFVLRQELNSTQNLLTMAVREKDDAYEEVTALKRNVAELQAKLSASHQLIQELENTVSGCQRKIKALEEERQKTILELVALRLKSRFVGAFLGTFAF